jgi:ADP-heptose:LPS heptosyltransferase
MKEALKVPATRKVAVLRANALGDFLFTLPALEALRNAYPHAEIVLLAKAWHAVFLSHRPTPIDRVVIIPPYIGVSAEPGTPENQAELEQFFDQLAREHFDIALQVQGGGDYSNPFMKRLHARVSAGLKAETAEPLDRWVPFSYFQPEIMRYLEVVGLVGATPVTVEPSIVVTEADRAEANTIVSLRQQPLVALHPGASDVRRRWPAQKFAQVGDALAAYGARIIVTGVQAEREVVAEVMRGMHAQAQDVCGQLSLNGLAGLLAQCSLVVANDTGPLHLAYAVETPSVGIYWAYNALTAGEMMRAQHRPLITWRMCCPVCGHDNSWGRCQHQVSFVADIQPEAVINAAKELL